MSASPRYRRGFTCWPRSPRPGPASWHLRREKRNGRSAGKSPCIDATYKNIACQYIYIYIYICVLAPWKEKRNGRSAGGGKWRELEWRFQVRFPGIYFHCQSARFLWLAFIIILTLYFHGYGESPCTAEGPSRHLRNDRRSTHTHKTHTRSSCRCAWARF